MVPSSSQSSESAASPRSSGRKSRISTPLLPRAYRWKGRGDWRIQHVTRPNSQDTACSVSAHQRPRRQGTEQHRIPWAHTRPERRRAQDDRPHPGRSHQGIGQRSRRLAEAAGTIASSAGRPRPTRLAGPNDVDNPGVMQPEKAGTSSTAEDHRRLPGSSLWVYSQLLNGRLAQLARVPA